MKRILPRLRMYQGAWYCSIDWKTIGAGPSAWHAYVAWNCKIFAVLV